MVRQECAIAPFKFFSINEKRDMDGFFKLFLLTFSLYDLNNYQLLIIFSVISHDEDFRRMYDFICYE